MFRIVPSGSLQSICAVMQRCKVTWYAWHDMLSGLEKHELHLQNRRSYDLWHIFEVHNFTWKKNIAVVTHGTRLLVNTEYKRRKHCGTSKQYHCILNSRTPLRWREIVLGNTISTLIGYLYPSLNCAPLLPFMMCVSTSLDCVPFLNSSCVPLMIN